MLGGLSLLRILLVEVAEGDDLGVTVESVVVERDLGVERLDLVVGSRNQRIDLDHRRVRFPEHGVKVADKLCGILLLDRVEPQPEEELPHLVIGQAVRGIDENLDDLFRRLPRHLLDLDATLGGRDDHRA